MYLLDCENGLDSVFIVVHFVINIIRFVIPVILILLGTIDLIKAVIAGKEDDIKKNQQVLMKRAIAGILIFLIPTLVMIIMGWIGNDDWKECWNNPTGNINTIKRNDPLNVD